MTIEQVLEEIIKLPENLHDCGTVSSDVLRGIVKHTKNLEIINSIETGSGKTSLLLTNISKNHHVFAINYGNSVSVVLDSPLLNKKSYNLIEGPTQKTLPAHNFNYKIQLAYLDGPHGYPFPDLEYYYIYPHLSSNALLIIDDILIPSIYNMYKIIKEDAMFEEIEVIGTTAFFKRTSAETFDPFADGWWLQNYNKKRYPIWINSQTAIKSFIPEKMKIKIKEYLKKIK